jgi:hypothetical protein
MIVMATANAATSFVSLDRTERAGRTPQLAPRAIVTFFVMVFRLIVDPPLKTPSIAP